MINQRGQAVWNGDSAGSGEITTQSGTVKVPYSVGARFNGEKGSNPEELVAAAHAACYTMFLDVILTKDGKQVKQLRSESKVTLDTSGAVPRVTKIALTTEGEVEGITQEEFQRYAETAKANCPISALLQGGVEELTLTSATLKS